MKSKFVILAGILLLVCLSVFAFAAEVEDAVGGAAPEFISNAGNMPVNMIYGKCVSDVAKLKNDCYEQSKNIGKNCTQAAKQNKDKVAAKTCKNDLKISSNLCKQNFKDAKKVCIQETKPNFWQRMKYSMK